MVFPSRFYLGFFLKLAAKFNWSEPLEGGFYLYICHLFQFKVQFLVKMPFKITLAGGGESYGSSAPVIPSFH